MRENGRGSNNLQHESKLFNDASFGKGGDYPVARPGGGGQGGKAKSIRAVPGSFPWINGQLISASETGSSVISSTRLRPYSQA